MYRSAIYIVDAARRLCTAPGGSPPRRPHQISCMPRVFAIFALVIFLGATGNCAQQVRSADQVLASARAEAAAQHKAIFLEFGASWCPPCREMEAFLQDREIRPILEKYFVIVTLNVFEQRGKHPELNSPGGEKLVRNFGGEAGGVPFLVFLNAQGQMLINSNRPLKGKVKGENVGYPDLPEEIDWFMTMLQRTIPTMAPAEARTIETWLRKRSSSNLR